MPHLRPIRLFLIWALPGQAAAFLVACLAAGSAPGLAWAVLLSLGFLAFAVAVSAAARPPAGSGSAAAGPGGVKRGAGGSGAVLALLDLRRNRGWYALVFAFAGVAAAVLAAAAFDAFMQVPANLAGAGSAADTAAVNVTVNVAGPVTVGHALLALALAYISAWLILGEAACSQAAIRRAFLGEAERT